MVSFFTDSEFLLVVFTAYRFQEKKKSNIYRTEQRQSATDSRKSL